MVADYTDEALDAECRLIGSLMLDPALWADAEYRVVIPPKLFCVPFHMAVYYAIIAAIAADQPCDPLSIWERVKTHEDAEIFGLAQLADLVADAASPQTFAEDQYVILAGGPSETLH